LHARQAARHSALIHLGCRGSPYPPIRDIERPTGTRFESPVGSRGESPCNSLAAPIRELRKSRPIHRGSLWGTRKTVDMVTLEWVDWLDQARLLEPMGYILPAEVGANDFRQLASHAALAV
jgi:hypothetical protein